MINLTSQVQTGGKIQFYSWRGLKQRREKFIPKDRKEAGNAIPTPALSVQPTGTGVQLSLFSKLVS